MQPVYQIADMHCDTLSDIVMMTHGEQGFKNAPGHINIAKLISGGSLLQCFAAFIPASWPKNNPDGLEPYEYFIAAVKAFNEQLKLNADSIAPVRRFEDIEKNRANGRISAMLTVEDGVPLMGELARVDEMFELGVRMVSITWNGENSLGYPNVYPDFTEQRGLKPFGIEALSRMNELGIVADVSHLSDGGFWDVVKHCKKPFVASHSNARALCNVVRNLTDDMLKALGDAGGVTGLNYCAEFLSPGAKLSRIEDIVRHARYIADKAGVEAVGLGSDFDGIECELEFGDAGGVQRIMQGLSSVFTPREIELISHKNVLRVLRDNFNA